jgi:Cell cycle regulated microtubule associated protein.
MPFFNYFYRYKFKATEFDPRIVEKQGMFGVKKIPEVSKTEIKPFRFEIEARIEQRKQKSGDEQPNDVCYYFMTFFFPNTFRSCFNSKCQKLTLEEEEGLHKELKIEIFEFFSSSSFTLVVRFQLILKDFIIEVFY